MDCDTKKRVLTKSYKNHKRQTDESCYHSLQDQMNIYEFSTLHIFYILKHTKFHLRILSVYLN